MSRPGRTIKKPRRGGAAVDKTCRCHGGCPACLGNRMISTKKKLDSAKVQLDELDLDPGRWAKAARRAGATPVKY